MPRHGGDKCSSQAGAGRPRTRPAGRVRHLDGILEHRHREGRIRKGREPQAEVGMRVDAVGEALNHPLEARHPRRRQVAVLQHHPIATPQRRRDERLGHRALPLAERRRAQPVSIAALGGKLEERGERIGAAGEDEDQRRAARRINSSMPIWWVFRPVGCLFRLSASFHLPPKNPFPTRPATHSWRSAP